ncbi:MAG: hypothetical protein JWR69_3013 [Pedosphaera sp.]|nr:hypothetical protein [Pedosphaera sp.]
MRNTLIVVILLAVSGLTGGCNGIKPQNRTVTATIANASTHELNGVRFECSGRYLRAGILSPNIDATIFDVSWPTATDVKVTFIDRQTRRPYSISISLVSVNEQVQAGKCHHVTIRILDYNKAEAVCE